MMDNVERVARAIWEADDYADEKATWDELDHVMEGKFSAGNVAKGQLMRMATAAISAMEPKWIKPTERLPDKPGKTSYEYVDCLIVHKGEVLKRPWNCEHLCFDDEDYDDFFCHPADVEFWMAAPAAPITKGNTNG